MRILLRPVAVPHLGSRSLDARQKSNPPVSSSRSRATSGLENPEQDFTFGYATCHCVCPASRCKDSCPQGDCAGDLHGRAWSVEAASGRFKGVGFLIRSTGTSQVCVNTTTSASGKASCAVISHISLLPYKNLFSWCMLYAVAVVFGCPFSVCQSVCFFPVWVFLGWYVRTVPRQLRCRRVRSAGGTTARRMIFPLSGKRQERSLPKARKDQIREIAAMSAHCS